MRRKGYDILPQIDALFVDLGIVFGQGTHGL